MIQQTIQQQYDFISIQSESQCNKTTVMQGGIQAEYTSNNMETANQGA